MTDKAYDANPMTQSGKRQSCPRCLRPLSTCLCAWVQVVSNQIELIILQHPLEVHQAKNTARLLHLCLNNSQIHVGENFGPAFFKQLQNKELNNNEQSTYDLLLYPETPEEKSLGINSPPLLDATKLLVDKNYQPIATLRLWVLDATWRKSRKMLYLNPELQAMPRVKLHNPPVSGYSIRKAHSENQLSTLEASCYALQQLEEGRVDYKPVLQAFAAFIQQQHTFIPSP